MCVRVQVDFEESQVQHRFTVKPNVDTALDESKSAREREGGR